MFFEKHWLQFFADGSAPAAEGDGAATGVESGTPGPNLEDLGVPAEKAEKFRQRRQKTAPKKAEPKVGEPTEPAPAEPKAMTWDEFMKIPENNERMQRTMSERVNKVAKESKEYVSKLAPALKLIAKQYDIKPQDDGSYDAEAIVNAVKKDDRYYEQKAAELGVDIPTARRIDNLEEENERNDEMLRRLQQEEQERERRQQRDQQLREHFMKMQQQADDVRDIMPNFNLEDAINDPQFVRLTSPEGGLSVKQALWALHGDEIQAQAVNALAQRARLDAANAIRSGIRPRENGSSTAAVNTTPNLKAMNREDRRAYIMQKYKPPDR